MTSEKRETARITVPFRTGDVMEEFAGYLPIGLSEEEWAYMLTVLHALKPAFVNSDERAAKEGAPDPWSHSVVVGSTPEGQKDA